MKVLLIDDDLELAQTMQEVLSIYSITLEAAYTPAEGLKKLAENTYDLLLLDVMLPNINGFEVCKSIRTSGEHFAHIPIIILSARTELIDRVVGLETGADDYVSKPFEPRELVARIHAIQRRMGLHEKHTSPESSLPANGQNYHFILEGESLKINETSAKIWVNEKEIEGITSMEFDLLVCLAKHQGNIVSNEELIQYCGANIYSQQGIIALIYRLRNKIKNSGCSVDFIRTVRNKGYSILGISN